MKIVTRQDLREWFDEAEDLAEFIRGMGPAGTDSDVLGPDIDLPLHLQYIVRKRAAEQPGPVRANDFASIPYYSLCLGLFLPLSSQAPERVAALFGIQWQPPALTHEEIVRQFFAKNVGLTFVQKLGCVLGDPFLGEKSTVRRTSLLRLLASVTLVPRRGLPARLPPRGEVAPLFAESAPQRRTEPPLTAAEVLETLRIVPEHATLIKFEILRSLLGRCGKLEAYFLAKLLLRKAGFGFDYQGPLLARLLAERFGAPAELVENAMALTDPLQVARILESEGLAGLRQIQLQPLSPVRPALAGGRATDIRNFPVWVERKYDGVRLLLHKSTDASGAVLCGAYTRNRHDWIELIPGLSATIRALPARTAIVDGELYGFVADIEGARPASVYEVHAFLHAPGARPVQLRFAAFDLLYLNGQDLTGQPLSHRRHALTQLLTTVAGWPLPIPLQLTEGQLVESATELNRLFHHFRAQGYEGIIAKNLAGPYRLAARDPEWAKRKPEITLDLVLLGAVFAVTSKEHAGLFGSYVIGARTVLGGFEIVGDVAGVDQERDRQLQAELMRQGLLTGRRIERPSATGTRPGLELTPAIVVTVRFEGIIRDQTTGQLSLRDPKIAEIRLDKTAHEADEVVRLEQLYLDARLS